MVTKNREFKGKSLIDFPDNFVVVDIETTGFNPNIDSIIQLGAIKIYKNNIIDTFNSLVNPEKEVKEKVLKITGITQEQLNQSKKIDEILPDFLEFIGDNIIVGHNISFDINFLYDKCLEILNFPLKNNFIDTLRIARKLIKQLEHHKIDNLMEYYNLGERKLHNANNDCLITFDIYKNMYNDIDNIEEFKKSFKRQRKTIYQSSYFTRTKDIIPDKSKTNKNHILYNKNCVITGDLSKLNRKEAMQLIANIGGIIQDNVTTKTNFLIIGNKKKNLIKGNKSSKQKKAEEYQNKGYNIEVITEEKFYNILFYNQK